MVVVSILLHLKFGPDDLREDAPRFTLRWSNWGNSNDLRFHGPPTPDAGQELCGFIKKWPVVVKQRVKTLTTPCMSE